MNELNQPQIVDLISHPGEHGSEENQRARVHQESIKVTPFCSSLRFPHTSEGLLPALTGGFQAIASLPASFVANKNAREAEDQTAQKGCTREQTRQRLKRSCCLKGWFKNPPITSEFYNSGAMQVHYLRCCQVSGTPDNVLSKPQDEGSLLLPCFLASSSESSISAATLP